MSIDNDKFQFVEQMKTAASITEAAVIFVMLGQNVVIFKSSMPVVQMGSIARKGWYSMQGITPLSLSTG